MKPPRGPRRASPFFLQTDGAVTEECEAAHAARREREGEEDWGGGGGVNDRAVLCPIVVFLLFMSFDQF